MSSENADRAVRAFLAAGPMTHAIRQAGGAAVEHGVREALAAFIGADGRVELPAWFRVVLARDGRP